MKTIYLTLILVILYSNSTIAQDQVEIIIPIEVTDFQCVFCKKTSQVTKILPPYSSNYQPANKKYVLSPKNVFSAAQWIGEQKIEDLKLEENQPNGLLNIYHEPAKCNSALNKSGVHDIQHNTVKKNESFTLEESVVIKIIQTLEQKESQIIDKEAIELAMADSVFQLWDELMTNLNNLTKERKYKDALPYAEQLLYGVYDYQGNREAYTSSGKNVGKFYVTAPSGESFPQPMIYSKAAQSYFFSGDSETAYQLWDFAWKLERAKGWVPFDAIWLAYAKAADCSFETAIQYLNNGWLPRTGLDRVKGLDIDIATGSGQGYYWVDEMAGIRKIFEENITDSAQQNCLSTNLEKIDKYYKRRTVFDFQENVINP